MEEPIKRLLLLQETDRKLDRVKADMEAIPRELQVHRREIEEHRLRFRGVEEALESNRAGQEALKAEQQELRSRVAEYRTRLLSIKTNDEYRAMLKQIDYALGKVDDMDTALLEAMEAEDEARAEVEKAGRELERYERRYEARKEMLEGKAAQLETELSALEAEREVVASSIDVRYYRKYRQARRSGRPEIVVGLRGGACGGCLTNVPPQNGVDIKGGNTFLCPMCGSFVVWTEDSSLAGGR